MSPEYAEYLRKRAEEWAQMRESGKTGDDAPELEEEEEKTLDRAWERTQESQN
jgi:hypothetical protein